MRATFCEVFAESVCWHEFCSSATPNKFAMKIRRKRLNPEDTESRPQLMSNEIVSQHDIIRKNTSAIADLQRKEKADRSLQGRIADRITDFSGSMSFVYLHAVWFGIWILLNIGLIHIPHLSEFDPFPFGLLTLIVSLEAIFLSTFVLISQNRLSQVSEKRADLDLQVNMLAEQKTAKTLELLEQIARQLDGMNKHFTFAPDAELEALKVSPEPQEVLKVMEDAVKEETREVKAEIGKAVEDITGEVAAVREDVDHIGDEVKQVASEMREVKEGIKS